MSGLKKSQNICGDKIRDYPGCSVSGCEQTDLISLDLGLVHGAEAGLALELVEAALHVPDCQSAGHVLAAGHAADLDTRGAGSNTMTSVHIWR